MPAVALRGGGCCAPDRTSQLGRLPTQIVWSSSCGASTASAAAAAIPGTAAY